MPRFATKTIESKGRTLALRTTECCGAFSTYSDTVLCCKSCWAEVPIGQGDGIEFVDVNTHEIVGVHAVENAERIYQ